MSNNFRDQFAIVGLGMTQVSRALGYSPRVLQAEAARLAIEDAGLKSSDIEAAINAKEEGGTTVPPEPYDAFPRMLGLPAKCYFTIGRGGAAAALSVIMATKLLELDIAKYVVVAFGSNWLTRIKRARAGGQEFTVSPKEGQWGLPFGQTAAVSAHVFFAVRHMHEYGTTSRQLGGVAVAARSWACLNPAAGMYGRPITVEDHQNSPIVVSPYHLLDICQVSEGGTAFIVTTAERARDLRKRPVYIMGFGMGDHMRQMWWEKTNYTQLDIEPAKTNAFRQAGVELKDIDVAQLYDCFTAEIIFELEGYGWCKKGEGGPFVEAGNIGPGGTIPVNTGGGMLSSHHHLDFTHLAEAVIQLRGEGGARQVKEAKVALVSGHGGEIVNPMCSVHSTLILRR